MKNKVKSQTKLCLVILLTLGIISPYPQSFTKAEEGSGQLVQTSQEDFQTGTVDSTLELNQSPGDLKLKQNLNTYTETTKEDFDRGTTSLNSLSKTEINSEDNGSIQLGRSYLYNSSSNPSIGSDSVRYLFKDDNNNLIYICTQDAGLSVIDTKGTADSSDDSSVTTYNTTSNPSIGGNDVWHAFLDSDSGLLYVSAYGGFSIIDTQKTVDSSDDTLVKSYNTSSSPAIDANNLLYSFLDKDTNVLYIGTNGGGMTAIDTKGTISPNDDVLLKTYKTNTSPALGSNTVLHIFKDKPNNLFYISTWGGLTVIDTKGTIDASDDTRVINYNETSSPAIYQDVVLSAFLDSSHNLLYIGGWGGGKGKVSVIDTKGTVNSSDDILLKVYAPESQPNISGIDARRVFLDQENDYLYITGCDGTSVINTKGNADPSDDELVQIYSSTSSPALTNGCTYDSYLDHENNLLYFGELGSGGLEVLHNDGFNRNGIYASRNISADSTPHQVAFWDETKNSNQSVSLQTRTASIDSWRDDFDDGNASEFQQDPYDWGDYFNNTTESSGTMKLSDSTPFAYGDNQATDIWIDTGKPDGYFPAGTVIKARIRVNSNREQSPDWHDYMYTDDWSDGNSADGVFWPNNEWVDVEMTAGAPFSKISFEPVWKKDTWNNSTDSFELDYISAEFPTWSPWSIPCTNSYGCPIEDTTGKSYLQYKLNLSTDDPTSTPSVNSVTLASGYQAEGLLTSPVLDSGNTSEWTGLTEDASIPTNTSITYQTRVGDTPTPDSTWEDWKDATSAIASRDSRYIQYKTTLSTQDQNQTPTLHALTINFSNSTYTPVLKIGNNTMLNLTPDSQLSLKTPVLTFSGQVENLSSATILQIFQDGSLLKNVKINKNHRYRYRIKPRRNQTHTYEFRYLDKDKQTLLVSPTYTILIDKQSPQITNIPKTITKNPGDTIEWSTTDNDQIDHYLLTFRGTKTTTTTPEFQIPPNSPKGLSHLIVRAYDRAGNHDTRKVGVRVR
jgi:hypothetical protein